MGSKHEKNGSPKLAQSDVRAIFECMYNNAPPPPHFKFSIVPVGPTGQKISPPSYEFEDGLYVLLKPMKKPKKKDAVWKEPTQPPDHLKHLIWNELPPENCPWSLSGPQFPDHGGNAIQQRYCYPKGDPDYSRFKGGAVWTMYYEDGKEAEEFRLLHVYYSNKRASNRQGKATKRRKRTKETTAPGAMTPPRSLASTVTYATSPLSTSSVTFRPPTVSNDAESATSAALESPVAVAATEQASSVRSEFWPVEQPIVTPINDILPRTPTRDGHDNDDDDMSSLQSQSESGYGGYNLTVSPFRRSNLEGVFGINVCNSPLQRTGAYRSILPDDKDGLLDYMPPADDLRSILTEPIMSYDDDDDDDNAKDDASCISGLEALRENSEDPKLTEPEDTLAEWERKLAGESLMDAFDDVEFREQMSMPYFEAI